MKTRISFLFCLLLLLLGMHNLQAQNTVHPDDYAAFHNSFNYEIGLTHEEYTRYGVDTDCLLTIPPFTTSGISAYAQGKIEDVNGLNLYVVRQAIPQGDTCVVYEDWLYIGDGKKLYPRKGPVRLGYYTEKDEENLLGQAYWFDYDRRLHKREQTGVIRDKGVPYIVEYERIYDVNAKGLRLKEELPDTLYCPETYSQFKSLFATVDAQDASSCEPGKRLAKNKFGGGYLNPEYNLYAKGKLENHQGYDLFFLCYTFRCPEPGVEGTFHHSTSIVGYNTGQPDGMPLLLDLGSSISSEGGREAYDYHFNTDGSLSVTQMNGICCSATGFETEVYTVDGYRYSFTDEEAIKEPRSRITSDFFDWQKLREIGQLPTKKNLLYIMGNVRFYVDTTQVEHPRLHFVSYNRGGELIDSLTLYSNGKMRQKQVKANTPQESEPMYSSEFLLETGNGNFLIHPNGTFQLLEKDTVQNRVTLAGRDYPCHAATIRRGDEIYLTFSEADAEQDPHGTNHYGLSFQLKTNDGKLPVGRFSGEDIQWANVLRFYPEWYIARHQLPSDAKQATLEINYSELDDSYHITGRLPINHFGTADTVTFSYQGYIENSEPEVTGIRMFTGNSRKAKGNLMLQGKSYNMPAALFLRQGEANRLYFTDRNLIMDSKLEYGVYFDLPDEGIELSSGSGTFNFAENDAAKVAFFHKGKTEHPLKASCTMTRNWEVYTIKYRLEMADGRVITGSFQGEVISGS